MSSFAAGFRPISAWPLTLPQAFMARVPDFAKASGVASA